MGEGGRRWEDGGARQKRNRAEGKGKARKVALMWELAQPPQTFNPDFPQPAAMANPALEIPEAIQAAHIRSNPSSAHDINPSTAASEKHPVVAAPASDAGSLPSDFVDPSRVIRPVRRRQTLPPLPDLRFEQSYLASIKDADTWGRVAWITVRDQVRGHAEQP